MTDTTDDLTLKQLARDFRKELSKPGKLSHDEWLQIANSAAAALDAAIDSIEHKNLLLTELRAIARVVIQSGKAFESELDK